jgi:hypothetical protein
MLRPFDVLIVTGLKNGSSTPDAMLAFKKAARWNHVLRVAAE